MPSCYKCGKWMSLYGEDYVKVEGKGYHEACAPPDGFRVRRCVDCFTLIDDEAQLVIIDQRPHHRDCAIAKGLRLPKKPPAITTETQSKSGREVPDDFYRPGGTWPGKAVANVDAVEPTTTKHKIQLPALVGSPHKGRRGWRKRHPEWREYQRQVR